MEINTALRAHQLERSENLALLHTYLSPIIDRFYGGDLPLPALSFDYARPGNLGWYCDEDGLALYHRININRLYADRPFAEVLRTLTHEVGHCWQHLSGKPSDPPYHNKQFQTKMLEIGIPCDSRGHSIGMQEPFVRFLKELGVEAEPFPFKQVIPVKAGTSRSRLKPWSCGCTRIWASIRVAVDATCTKQGCGNPFQRQ
jgi:hypothetical protein